MDLDEVKRSLEKRLADLGARVSKIESDLRDPGSKDSEERAAEVENDEVLERLNESERREIEELRAALVRIREGTYSTCSSCGNEIAAKRLQALPCTNVCVSCAS
jgi:DnaK suppressor protein